MSNLDLHILPRYRRDGQEMPDLPGLFVADAPRRATRSRKGDILLLHTDGLAEHADGENVVAVQFQQHLRQALIGLTGNQYSVPGQIVGGKV